MGMGSAPCHAWIISLDSLKAICPQEVEACEAALRSMGYNWDSFALAMGHENIDDSALLDSWEDLRVAFTKATQVGKCYLDLGIGHYSSKDGDQYDELEDGCYFTVDNVTQLTPSGKKFREHLEEKSWTVYC